ncbi:AMP-binding protein [Streptacidiphilus sp. 4-A2]|nr:AMP-binding protein [Streptacidiphilus sp. 4-A2]
MGVEVVNVYGPTEAAIDVTAHRFVLESGSGSGSGSGWQWWCGADWWPIQNVRVYVLDGGLGLVPVGGVSCMWGVRVGAGYLGRGGLTASRFVGIRLWVVGADVSDGGCGAVGWGWVWSLWSGG